MRPSSHRYKIRPVTSSDETDFNCIYQVSGKVRVSSRRSYPRNSSPVEAERGPKVLQDVEKCVLFGEPAGAHGAASDLLSEGSSAPPSNRRVHTLPRQGGANLVVRDRQSVTSPEFAGLADDASISPFCVSRRGYIGPVPS